MSEERQTVVVTGASRGLGSCLVRQFLDLGAVVIAHVRSSAQRDSLIAKYTQEHDSRLLVVCGDLIDSNSIEQLGLEICRKVSRLDVLINNAGVFSHQRDTNFDMMSRQFFTEAVQVNLVAPVLLTHCLLPLLRKSPKPLVVNVLTDLVRRDSLDGSFPAYRTSKAGLAMFTINQAANNNGVCMIGFDPGWMRTDMGGLDAPDDPVEVASSLVQLIMTPSSLKTGQCYKDLSRVEL